MCEEVYYDYYNGKQLLYCNIDKKICPFSRWCSKEMKAIENHMERCKKMENKNIPNGASKVLFVKKIGDKTYLYIDYNGTAIKVLYNEVKNINSKYVYVKKLNNGTYIIDTKPIVVEQKTESTPSTKRKYTKKKSTKNETE